MSEDDLQPIGKVIHFFDRISVAIVEMWAGLTLGDWVWFFGEQTNFVQPIESMQINDETYEEILPDESGLIEVAIQIDDMVREGDWVYPYTPEGY